MTFARPTSSDSHHSNFNARRRQEVVDAELEQDPDHDPEADPDVELDFHEGHIARNSRKMRYSSRGGSGRSPTAAAAQTGELLLAIISPPGHLILSRVLVQCLVHAVGMPACLI